MPGLLTLFVYDDRERPIMCDDRILFFTKPELGARAIEHAGLAEQFPRPAAAGRVAHVRPRRRAVPRRLCDVAAFFDEHGLPRLAAQDALLWSAGAITARARVIG